MISRIVITAFFISFFHSVSYSQKPFEGKITGEIIRENVPENMKPFATNGTYTIYCKKNKSRYESTTKAYSTINIEDHNKGIRLMIMDMGALAKTAMISSLVSPTPEKENIEKVEEYKMIAGHNCQKTIVTSVINGKERKSISYVSNEFTQNGPYRASGPTYFKMGFETIMEIEGQGTMTMRITSVSEEPENDALFDLTPPAGYKVTDMTKKTGGTPAPQPTEVKQSVTQTGNNYDNVSNSDLKKMLDDALAKEDFETAQAIKVETDKRKQASAGKYGQYSVTQLKKMIDDAVSKDDFATAQEIKEEIGRRPKQ